MKTAEQLNKIRIMKGYIAELVTKHKETKKSGRGSLYHEQRESLFILYQVYHILRHEVTDLDAFVEALKQTLKPDKRSSGKYFYHENFGANRYGRSYSHLKTAIQDTLKYFDAYVERQSVVHPGE